MSLTAHVRPAVRALLALVALVLLSTLLSTPRAEAAQFAGTAGRVGSVQLHGPMITGSDYRTNGYAYSSFWWKAWETSSPARPARRSR